MSRRSLFSARRVIIPLALWPLSAFQLPSSCLAALSSSLELERFGLVDQSEQRGVEQRVRSAEVLGQSGP